jgi:Tfp pilus assembly protein PilV
MNTKGQSLFEVIFALGIAAIILVAMASLSASTLRNSSFSTDSATTTQLSSQATEWLRSQRDANWAAFAARATTTGTTWCLSSLAWPAAAGACGPKVDGTVYTRSVILKSRDADSTPGVDTIDAAITVSWSDSQGTHDVKNNASYTDWRK